MFRLIRHSQGGQVLQGMLFGALSLVVVMVLVSLRTVRSQFTNKKLRDNIAQAQLSSGIETAVWGYRIAEMSYMDQMQNCSVANPFLVALKKGTGCVMDDGSDGPTFTAFAPFPTPVDVPLIDNLYEYSSPGCQLTKTTSTCTTGLSSAPIFSVGTGATQKINGNAYKFYLLAPDPDKQVMLMRAEIITADQKTLKNEFAIRTLVPNLAHLELSDSRVTQEHPDPLSKCKGSEWGTMQVYNVGASPPCQDFQQLGGGTGLAYNNGRYFGLRPMDGQIVDLVQLINGASSTYMVNEDGTINGEAVMPPYSKELLTNIDDITVSGGQIQTVSGMGEASKLSVLDKTGSQLVNVCPLGTMGWSQSYSGIAALNWNDPLYPLPTAAGDRRLGIFMLKTDGGDLLEVGVTATSAGYGCCVLKDSSMQNVEYKRTGGFDRTNDSLPYYVF